MTEHSWFGFVVAVFAVWRVAHLVAREDGPFDVVLRLRRRAGNGPWGRLMDCPYCMSLWLALPAAAWLTPRSHAGAFDAVLLWLAISGAACCLERVAARGEHDGELPK